MRCVEIGEAVTAFVRRLHHAILGNAEFKDKLEGTCSFLLVIPILILPDDVAMGKRSGARTRS
jgi:hypothetical protein